MEHAPDPAKQNPSPGFQRDPNRSITVTPLAGVVTVTLADTIIASSENVLTLREAEYQPVLYIPFEDIYFEFLSPSATRTNCPYKGDAKYWNASAGGEGREDAMWAYQKPYDEMTKIKDYGAFYPTKVKIDIASM
ncbi:DUF427 domain-containing protein [Mesorhizobium sp. SB112]|uniref:DUF427 domain-containing protein n=1 Tax=Mesorhizobium sp. SB112 TaxID=3151853 RepID=UPI0032666911